MNLKTFYFKKFKRPLLLMMVLVTLVNALSAFYGLGYKYFIDALTNADFQRTLLVLAFLFSLLFVNTLFTFLAYTYLLRVTGIRISHDIGKRLFKEVLHKPLSFYSRMDIGTLVTRTFEDSQVLGDFITLHYFVLVANTLRFAINTLVMWFLSPLLTLLTLATMPFYYLLARCSFKAIKRARVEERLCKDAALEHFRESVSRVETIHSYGAQSFFSACFDRKMDALTGAQRKALLWNEANRVARDFMYALVPLLILGGGVLLLYFRFENMTIGTLLGFKAIVGGAYVPIGEVVYYQARKHDSQDYFRRAQEVWETEALAIQSFAKEGTQGLEIKNPVIHLGKQSLRVPLSLQIKGPGLYRIQGRNGSGKSSLLRLLKGLYSLEGGEVSLSAEIERIGYLPQGDGAFSLTLEENILLGREGLVTSAPPFPMEKEGILGPSQLSGGETKKIALNRVFSAPWDLLLLDEPFEFLEAEGGETLKALLKEKKGDTIILIVHHGGGLEGLTDACFSIEV